jgi:hypothetical protein
MHPCHTCGRSSYKRAPCLACIAADRYGYKPPKDDPENYQQIGADDWVERQQQQAEKDAAQQQQPGLPSEQQVQPERYEYRGNEYKADPAFKPNKRQPQREEIIWERRPAVITAPQPPQTKAFQDKAPDGKTRSQYEPKAPEQARSTPEPRETAPEVHTPRDTIRRDPLADLRDLQKQPNQQQQRQEAPEVPVTPPHNEAVRGDRTYDPLADMKYHRPDSKYEYPRYEQPDPLADMRYHANAPYDRYDEPPRYDLRGDEEPQTVGSYHKYHFKPEGEGHDHHDGHHDEHHDHHYDVKPRVPHGHVNPDAPKRPNREDYEPQDSQEYYSGDVVGTYPERPTEREQIPGVRTPRDEYERQQQQHMDEYERQQQQAQYSPKPRQQPISEYLPSPAQQPPHDTDGWWEQQRDQAVRKRAPGSTAPGRDAVKPAEPVLEDQPVHQYNPQYNVQYEPQYQRDQQYNHQQGPRYQQQKPVYEESTIVEKFGRK